MESYHYQIIVIFQKFPHPCKNASCVRMTHVEPVCSCTTHPEHVELQHHAGGSHTSNHGLQNSTHNITLASNIMTVTHIVQVLTTAL